MGKTHPHITDDLRAWIEQQRLFFVATAPTSIDAHVNVSPKGLDAFCVLAETRVAYLDLTGSGNETSAHLEDNGRITFMFCAFDGDPRILRLYGRGQTHLPGTPEFAALASLFGDRPGVRQVITADIDRVQTSCGFGVPRFQHVADRDLLPQWARKKGPAGLHDYQQRKNRQSIDGLPTTLSRRNA
jgi:hypothetical protein